MGTQLVIKRAIKLVYLPVLDFSTATLGARLRYLRKRLGYTITSLATMTKLGHNTIARLEREEAKSAKPWVLGRIPRFISRGSRTRFRTSPAMPTTTYPANNIRRLATQFPAPARATARGAGQDPGCEQIHDHSLRVEPLASESRNSEPTSKAIRPQWRIRQTFQT